jgi:hypothetical protein
MEENKGPDWQKMVDNLIEPPGHIQSAMVSYGVGRCDFYAIPRAANM